MRSDVRICWEFVHPRDPPDPPVIYRSVYHPSTDLAPWNASASTALAEDVHPCHVEVLRGLQHVAIVGIDLFKAMLLSAGQV